MKIRKMVNTRLALAIAVAAAAIIGAIAPGPIERIAWAGTPTPASGITPVSQFPTSETKMIEHAVNDKYFGDALANALDTVWGVKIAYGGVFASSNDTIVVTAYRPTKTAWLNATAPDVMNAAVGYGSAAVNIWVTDTAAGGVPLCGQITGTALTSMAIGTNGGYAPLISGKMGLLMLNSAGTATLKVVKTPTLKSYGACVQLPNGRIATGATMGSF